MPEENTPNDPPKLVLDEVVDVPVDDLDDNQKTFLRESTDDLTDEQKETFKGVLEEEEEEEVVDPTKVKVKTRVKTKKPKVVEEDEGDEEDGDVDPDDEKTIGKVVKTAIKPIEDKLDAQTKRSQKLADEAEVDAHIRDNPEYKKYRGVILKYMKHPSYDNIPAASVAAIVSAEDQQKIGAKKEREAAEKVKETQGGGSSSRKPEGGKIDWDKATPKEMAAKRQEILDRSRE
jgi:hypothetical protein